MFHSPAQNFSQFSFPTFFFSFFFFFFSYTIFSFLCSFSSHFSPSHHTTSLSPHNSSSYSPLMPPPYPPPKPPICSLFLHSSSSSPPYPCHNPMKIRERHKDTVSLFQIFFIFGRSGHFSFILVFLFIMKHIDNVSLGIL